MRAAAGPSQSLEVPCTTNPTALASGVKMQPKSARGERPVTTPDSSPGRCRNNRDRSQDTLSGDLVRRGAAGSRTTAQELGSHVRVECEGGERRARSVRFEYLQAQPRKEMKCDPDARGSRAHRDHSGGSGTGGARRRRGGHVDRQRVQSLLVASDRLPRALIWGKRQHGGAKAPLVACARSWGR